MHASLTRVTSESHTAPQNCNTRRRLRSAHQPVLPLNTCLLMSNQLLRTFWTQWSLAHISNLFAFKAGDNSEHSATCFTLLDGSYPGYLPPSFRAVSPKRPSHNAHSSPSSFSVLLLRTLCNRFVTPAQTVFRWANLRIFFLDSLPRFFITFLTTFEVALLYSSQRLYLHSA